VVLGALFKQAVKSYAMTLCVWFVVADYRRSQRASRGPAWSPGTTIRRVPINNIPGVFLEIWAVLETRRLRLY